MTSPPVEYARREVLPPLEVRLGTSGHRPGWVGRLSGPVAVCALVTLIVLPAVMSLLFVRSYGVDVPFMDDWRNVLLLEKLYNGTITVRDLFRPANEHLTTIPYIVFLVLGYVTHYDTTTSMYASWFFIAISSIIVYASVRQALTSATRALIVFLPVTWLLFSPRQSQALLTETTMCIFLMNLGVIAAFYGLMKSRGLDGGFLVAIAGAVLASLSFAQGALVWPIGVAQMVLLGGSGMAWRRYSRTALARVGLWCLAGGLVIAAYAYIYAFTSGQEALHRASRAVIREQPSQVVSYALAAIGGTLLSEGESARVMGLLLLLVGGLALIAAAWQWRHVRGLTVPLCLTVYWFVAVALLAVGRVSLGTNQALESRYSASMMPGLVGLYLLVALLSPMPRWPNIRVYGTGFVVGLLTLGVLTAVMKGEADGQKSAAIRQAAAYYVQTFEVQSDRNLLTVFPSAPFVRSYAPILRTYGLSVFRDRPPDPATLAEASGSTRSSLDVVNGQALGGGTRIRLDRQRDDTVTIVGWAVDVEAGRPASAVFLTVDGRLTIPTRYGEQRPDVAAALGGGQYGPVGYQASFGIQTLGPGRHTISVKIVAADGERVYRGPEVVVDVT